MAYLFDATHIFCEDDDYMIMLGFADDELEPNKFVILQQSRSYDDQDRELGMDKLHIQVEDQSRSQYGGITAVNVTKNRVTLSLDKSAQSTLMVDGDIEISFSMDHPKANITLFNLEKISKRDGIIFSK